MTETNSIDKLLIGDNPFNGVDHLSQERSREKAGQMSIERISRVIQVAFENGAEGFSFSICPNTYNVLKHLKQTGYDRRFGLYPILPDAQSSVRVASEKGILGLLTDAFGKMSIGTKAKSLLYSGLGALTLNPIRLMKTYVNAEMSIFLDAAPAQARLKTVLLHEIVTDLIVSLGMTDLFTTYIDFIEDSFNVFPGFVTRNFARFVDFVKATNIAMSRLVVLAPFNNVGFQMNPSREECEAKLLESPDLNLIAMSVLAAGYSNLNDGTKYLSGLKKRVSCVIGVSSEAHASETFSILRSSFHTL